MKILYFSILLIVGELHLLSILVDELKFQLISFNNKSNLVHFIISKCIVVKQSFVSCKVPYVT